MREGLGGLLQRVPADDEVGDQVEQQVLPGGPLRVLFHDHGHGEQDGRDGDFDDGPPRAFLLLVVMVVLVFMLVLVMMFVRVCHIACFLLSGHKDTGLPLQPGCKSIYVFSWGKMPPGKIASV